MRNPIRIKNFRWRFLPFLAAAGVMLLAIRPEPVTFGFGLVAVAAGSSLRAWGAGHLIKTERLALCGPYARMRHPLYLGTLLAVTGFALMVGGWWTLVALACFLPWFFGSYFPRKDLTESARLEERYGDAFREYRRQVPALFPRLRAWQPTPAVRAIAQPATRWSLARYSDNNELGTFLGLAACSLLFGLRAWQIF